MRLIGVFSLANPNRKKQPTINHIKRLYKTKSDKPTISLFRCYGVQYLTTSEKALKPKGSVSASNPLCCGLSNNAPESA